MTLLAANFGIAVLAVLLVVLVFAAWYAVRMWRRPMTTDGAQYPRDARRHR